MRAHDCWKTGFGNEGGGSMLKRKGNVLEIRRWISAAVKENGGIRPTAMVETTNNERLTTRNTCCSLVPFASLFFTHSVITKPVLQTDSRASVPHIWLPSYFHGFEFSLPVANIERFMVVLIRSPNLPHIHVTYV